MGMQEIMAKGYVKGEPQEIESVEQCESGAKRVKRTYRIFEVTEVSPTFSEPQIEDKKVLAYPGWTDPASAYDQMVLLQGGTPHSGLPDHLEIFGYFEEADNKDGPFAGMIDVRRVYVVKGENEKKAEPLHVLGHEEISG